jgi:membrane-bound serine protease (ClpP class)
MVLITVAILLAAGGIWAESDKAASGPADQELADKNRSPAAEPLIVRINVDGAINPVTAAYIEDQIEQANADSAELLVLTLDTPGGLMESTRQIVKAELASRIPVAVYVYPQGGRAASAGVFITMAAHIAAMAPGTNIGAAHPVNVGGGGFPGQEKKEGEGNKSGENGEEGEEAKDGEGEAKPAKESDDDVMAQKVLNDTVAFVRTIAEKNGRNADWAERAVRESISSTENEALEAGVIDLIAEDLDDLLEKIEGMTVKVSGEDVVLALGGGRVEDRPMDWKRRILAKISDPNVAYILMMLGIYGIFFELANPGVILPGVMGGIFLVLAFFSFQVLPINYAGVLLILLALILFILEVKVVSFGMLTVGGIVSLFLGSIMLIDSAEPYLRISRTLILGMTGFTALVFILGVGLAVKGMRKKPTTGTEGLVGKVGVATTDFSPNGKIKVHGEIWSASSEAPIKTGDTVRVESINGLFLKVTPVEDDKTI